MLSCKKRLLAVLIMILGLGDDIHGIDPFQQRIKPVGIIQRIDLGFGALRRGIDADDLYAVVEPGVITAQFAAAVSAKTLFYPPDPVKRPRPWAET